MGSFQEDGSTISSGGSSQAQTEALGSRQEGDHRRHEKAMGDKEGGSSETGTGRRQESRCQKGSGEEGTKGGEESCGQGRRPEGGTKEVRPSKGGESPGQEGFEEVGFGHCSTHRGGGISTDIGSRGAVGFVPGHRDQEPPGGIDHPALDPADRRAARRAMTGAGRRLSDHSMLIVELSETELVNHRSLAGA